MEEFNLLHSAAIHSQAKSFCLNEQMKGLPKDYSFNFSYIVLLYIKVIISIELNYNPDLLTVLILIYSKQLSQKVEGRLFPSVFEIFLLFEKVKQVLHLPRL